ncbi:antirestriction protein ArdA [Aliiroseovarius sp.]|uniref:antirestriction protein ArdA n=1 Tax=Aliiroseovarius sp. TaxID=1872442 RepID=UPI003BAB8E7E
MPALYAQPYDLSANGFYFESMENYAAKADSNCNDYGNPVEEYEIQFIDGDQMDRDLAKAWGINQANTGQYLEACESWDDHDKLVFIIAVGEVGYSFDPATVSPSDFDVDIYRVDSMKELAEQFVEEGLFGEIPEHLAHYIDLDSIANDLAMDYTETEITGQRLVYRAV